VAGREGIPWSEFFRGIVDEVRVWEVARVTSQIHADMQEAIE